MILTELYDPPVSGYQDISSDNSKPVYKTSRNTKLTLRQIRKLRRMLDVRTYEKKNYLEQVRNQYGPKPEQAAGPPM